MIPTRSTLILSGTVFLSLFAAMGISGILTAYQLGWCEAEWLCTESLKVLGSALEIALIALIATAFCAFGFRASLFAKRTSTLVMIGLISTALLFFALPYALDVRASLASQFFPYVIALRFGFAGMLIVWGAFSFVICALVVAITIRMNRANVGA